jgi:hypothetical protein
MATVFDALPGMEVPVGSISQSLGAMWADVAAHGAPAPTTDDTKATQVNFVLHLGFNARPPEAVTQFQTAVRFSRRYPSRVVVLCPLDDSSRARDMRAKVYGECTLGKSKSDKRCCEFVMLSYPYRTRQYLESLVSTCLSTDLPLYYWAHGFAASARLAEYHYLLTRSRRVLIDSATAPADALTYPWPRPEIVRDLAHARLLPVRQTIGQFLSRYPDAALATGLTKVTVASGAATVAEARVLLHWVRERMEQCSRGLAARATPVIYVCVPSARDELGLTFSYVKGKSFVWKGDLRHQSATFAADFGTGATALRTPLSLLAPEDALGEAMFF